MTRLKLTRYFLKSGFLLLILMLSGCSNDVLLEEQLQESFQESLSAKNQAAMKMKMTFSASLKGDNEVPAKETNAAGECIVRINKDESAIYFKLIVANITDVVAAHFHWAPAGENGPVVIALYGGEANGTFNGILAHGNKTKDDLTGPLEGMEMSDFIDALKEGNIYVNVHTIENPGGEIRGQL